MKPPTPSVGCGVAAAESSRVLGSVKVQPRSPQPSFLSATEWVMAMANSWPEGKVCLKRLVEWTHHGLRSIKAARSLKPPGRNGELGSPGGRPGPSGTVLVCWRCVEGAESWDDGDGWNEGSGRGPHFLMKDRRRARHCAPHIGHIGWSSECKQTTTFAKVLAPKDNCKTGRGRATNAEQKTRKWRTGDASRAPVT